MLFFIIPTGVDYRAQRYPVVTFTMMGLCIVVWVLETILRLSGNNEPEGESLVPWFFSTFGLVPADGRIFPWLTYMFVHGGFFHLLFNMIYLFLFGSCVEDILGRVRFTIFYVAGGVLAALAQIAFTAAHFESTIPLVGASGAISACMGAFLPLFYKTRIDFKWFLWIIFYIRVGEFSIKAWIVMSCWFLKDVAYAILSYDAGVGTAFAAHAGGWVSGLGAMFLFKLLLKRGVVRSAAQEALEAGLREAGEPLVYVFDGEQQTGPFPVSELLERLRRGSLSAQAHYWREGMSEWRRISDLTQSG